MDFEIQITQDCAPIGEMVGNVTEFNDGVEIHGFERARLQPCRNIHAQSARLEAVPLQTTD